MSENIEKLREAIVAERDTPTTPVRALLAAMDATNAAWAAVEQEMAELRKDKERLDWLDAKGDVYAGWQGYAPNMPQHEFHWTGGRFGNRLVERDPNTPGLRAAIDAEKATR